MEIFCYGDFLDRKVEKHKPSNNATELTTEQKWAQKCGKRWNKQFPYSAERKPDVLINESESTPIRITDYFDIIQNDIIIDISSFDNHYLIHTSKSDVYSLGDQAFGKCGIGEEVYDQIIAEEEERFENEDGTSQLDQYSSGIRFNPVKIMGGIDAFATGKHHSVLVTKRGDVYSFGRGTEGQLGNGVTKNTLLPQKIPYFGKDGIYGPVYHASCGDFHTLVLTKEKMVYGFGRGKEGQLGILPYLELESKNNTEKRDFGRYFLHHPAPRSVKAYDYRHGIGRTYLPLVDVVCGSRFSLILSNERKVLTFGEGMTGALSQGHTKNMNCPSQVHWAGPSFPGLSRKHEGGQEEMEGESEEEEEEELRRKYEQEVIRLESGWEHFVCVSSIGEAFSSGLNLRGQCGVGHSNNVKKLTKIQGLEECTIEKIGCGCLYTACLSEDRNLYVCGNLPGRWNDYLEMTRLKWFEKNGYRIINIFCGGKNLFVQAIRLEDEESEDEEYERQRIYRENDGGVEREGEHEELEEEDVEEYMGENMGEGTFEVVEEL